MILLYVIPYLFTFLIIKLFKYLLITYKLTYLIINTIKFIKIYWIIYIIIPSIAVCIGLITCKLRLQLKK